MATQQGGKKKGKKVRTLNLQEFLSGSGGDPNLGKNVSVVRAVKEVGGGTNWADEMEAFDTVEIQTLVLPSAPKASRGPDIDMADLPDHPPYTVYVANLPYDSCEDDLKNFFRELNVIGVRLQKDNNERLKGFGYVDFGDRESIIEALSMHETTLRTRALRITLSNADNERGQRRGGDRYGGERDRDRTRNPDEPDRTTGDWRAGREKPAMDDRGPGGGSSYGSRNGPDNESRDTYSARGNRDRGFGDRDRGFGSGFSDRGGDRESRGGFGGDRESRGGFGGDRESRGGGGFGGDRESRGGGGFGGDREQRSGFGGDRGFDRDRGNRDRGFGGDRERDRGYERSRDSFGGSSFESRGGRSGTGGRYEESSGSNRNYGSRANDSANNGWNQPGSRGFGRGGGARRRDDREGGYQRDERYSRPFSRGNSRDRADVGGERSERAERSERPPRPTTPAGPTEDSVDSGARDVEHEQKHEKAAEPERPKERPRLKLLPRSKPAEEAAGADQTPSIFGGARPVDTAAREREIEEKLRREEDDKRRAQQDRPQQRGRRSGQYDEESGDGRTSRGAWQRFDNSRRGSGDLSVSSSTNVLSRQSSHTGSAGRRFSDRKRSDRSEDEHHPASESHEGHDDPRPRRPLSRHHDDEESHDEEHTMTEKRADSPPTPPTARVEAVPTENYWAKRQQQPAARSHSSASVEVSLDTPMSPEPRDERPEGDLEQPQRSEWHSSERRGGRDRDEASGPPRRGREWEDAGPPRGRDREEGGPPRGRDRDDTGPTRGRGGVRLGRGGGRGGGPARRVNSREGPGYIGAPSKSPGPSSEDEKKGRAGSIDDKEPLGRKTSNVSLPPPRKETVNVVPAPPPAVNVWQKRQEINKPKPQEVAEQPAAAAVPAVTPVQAEPAAPAPVPVAPQLEEKQPEKKVESIQREAAPPPVAQQQPPQQPAPAPQPPRNRGWEGRPLSAGANRAWGANPQQPSSNGAPGAGPAGDTVVSSTRRLSANPPPPAGKLGFGRGSKLQATAPAGPIVGVGSAPNPVTVAASVATAPSAPTGVLAPTPVAVPAAPTGVWGRPNKIRQMADEAAAKEKTATANKFAGLATTDSEESVGQ